MLIRDSEGNYESIGTLSSVLRESFLLTPKDFRETAPAAAFEDMYQGNPKGSVVGGLASAVPGEVLGLEVLHQKYGVSSILNLPIAPIYALF